jgi:hypothetical protein
MYRLQRLKPAFEPLLGDVLGPNRPVYMREQLLI